MPTAPSTPPKGSRAPRAARGTPSTLWKLLTGELWVVLVLTAAILVAIISFAAAIKPLADGDIGAGDAVRLMALFAVPMLQFAVPFAGGFAATMAYHRFAADREAVAAHAGGLSHRTLLVPALATGLVLGVAVAALSGTVIPRFLRSAESLIARDVARVIAAPLARGHTLTLDSWDIHAERVFDLEPDPAAGVLDHLVLEGVVLARAAHLSPTGRDGSGAAAGNPGNGSGRQTVYLSADRIDLLLFHVETAALGGAPTATTDSTRRQLDDARRRRGGNAGGPGGGTAVVPVLENVGGVAPDEAGLTRVALSRYRFERPLVIPRAFDDDPKYLTFNELLETLDEPRRIGSVDRAAWSLARALAERRLIEGIRSRLDGGFDLAFRQGETEVGVSGARAEVRGGRVRLTPIVRGGGRFEVTVTPAEGSAVVHLARSGELRFDDDASLAGLLGLASVGGGAGVSPRPRALLTLALDDAVTARIEDAASRGAGESGGVEGVGEGRDFSLSGLSMGEASLISEGALGVEELLAVGEGTVGTEGVVGADGLLDDEIARRSERLRERIGSLEREIVSKLNESLAYAAASVIMVVLGGVMALRLRESLPLVVYLWSFGPALVAVITISSGQTLASQQGVAGLVLLWGGVAGLGVLTVRQYRVLAQR